MKYYVKNHTNLDILSICVYVSVDVHVVPLWTLNVIYGFYYTIMWNCPKLRNFFFDNYIYVYRPKCQLFW